MTNTIEQERTPRRWHAFFISFVLLFGLGAVWALATPLMGVPDEPAHVIRAASVVRGDIIPRQSSGDPYMSDVDVPEWAAAAHALTCFAFDPGIPASCQPPAEDDDAITVARTSAGLNSPVYYAIVGLPSLVLDGPSALYAMRLVNVALTAALLAIAFMGLSQLPRARWSYVALASAITPMALFLAGGTNPNSIEFASAAALFATLLAVVRTPSPGWLLWERAAVVVVTAGLLVNTRSISLLWLAIIVVAAIALARRDVLAPLLKRPATWVTVGLAGLIAALTLAWFIRPQPEIPAVDVPVYPLIGGNFVLGAQIMLDRTLEFATGWIGLFGWIDTPSPSLSVLIWCTVIVGLVAAAALFGRGATRVVALLLVVAAIALPVVIQGILLADYGIIWQGRYMMAIYLCMMIAVGLALDDAPHSCRTGSGGASSRLWSWRWGSVTSSASSGSSAAMSSAAAPGRRCCSRRPGSRPSRGSGCSCCSWVSRAPPSSCSSGRRKTRRAGMMTRSAPVSRSRVRRRRPVLGGQRARRTTRLRDVGRDAPQEPVTAGAGVDGVDAHVVAPG